MMDAKITLSFDKEVIEKAKAYADSRNISLSRLTEFLYQKITSGDFQELDKFPIAEWVSQVAEGGVEYKSRGRKSLKEDFMKSKK